MFFSVMVGRRLASSFGAARGGQSMASFSFLAKTKSKNSRCLLADEHFALSTCKTITCYDVSDWFIFLFQYDLWPAKISNCFQFPATQSNLAKPPYWILFILMHIRNATLTKIIHSKIMWPFRFCIKIVLKKRVVEPRYKNKSHRNIGSLFST